MKSKMRKTVIIMLTAVMAISCLSIAMPTIAIDIGANELQDVQINQNAEITEFETKHTTEIGAVSKKESILIDGVENYLYPTFDDIDKSLELLEKAIPNYLKLVENNIDLKELYQTDYEVVLKTNVFPAESELKKLEEQISQSSIKNESKTTNAILSEEDIFNNFYDIYENKAKNEEIIEYLKNNANPDEETLAYLLPYDSVFAKEYFETAMISPQAAQYFNIENGITYATDHAVSVNAKDYGYFYKSDCTNFASQILVGGGIIMHDNYPDEQSGWWHRRTIDGLGHAQHRYSVSWINADRFVKFMGTHGNEYTSFYTLSSKLRRGDFIAYDGEQDGDWNHVGFATAIGSYGTYSYTDASGVLRSKYYRDFKVAQHTTDYHAWTSSDTNGWEKLDGTAKFAIVRRGAVA